MGEILAARGASGVVDDSRGDADTDAEWTEGETDDEVVLEIRDGGGGGSMGGLSSGFPSSGSLPAGAAGDGGVDRWRRLASSSDNTTLTAGTTVDGSEPSISESEGLLEDELEKLMERQKLRRLVVFLLSSWLAAAGLFQWTEPTWTYVDALYFCFTTISTIGYGDLFPTTAYAWELWFFYVMAAVGIYSLLITVLGEIGMRRYEAAAAFHRQRRHRHRANEQGRAKDTAGQTTSGKAKRRGTAKRRSALALQSASPSPPADTSRFRTAL
ncbi:hypothetical protein DFJ73DRAFT_15924 [Zopfochytrium polystomum]|nr:hypothetical protein DFJ73DRAFT_15924 [Zopfochytrium polystomum]